LPSDCAALLGVSAGRVLRLRRATSLIRSLASAHKAGAGWPRSLARETPKTSHWPTGERDSTGGGHEKAQASRIVDKPQAELGRTPCFSTSPRTMGVLRHTLKRRRKGNYCSGLLADLWIGNFTSRVRRKSSARA
jgi:hypothetical protein